MFLWISAFFFKAQMIAQAPGGCLKMVSTVIQETPPRCGALLLVLPCLLGGLGPDWEPLGPVFLIC